MLVIQQWQCIANNNNVVSCLLQAIGGFVIYLGVQIFQFNKTAELNQIIDTNLQTGALVVVGFGSAVALLALIGFLGACCESSLLLRVYGLVVFVLLVVQCVGIYFNYQLQHEYIDKFEKGLQNAITAAFNTDSGKSPELAFALQNIQLKLKCCGWRSPADYAKPDVVPASCCAIAVPLATPQETCRREEIKFNVGCKDSPVLKLVREGLNYTSYTLILVELILILAACCLAKDLARYQPVSTFG